MSVTVSRASVVKLWRQDVTPMIGVRSKAPVEQLLKIVGDAIHRQNEVNSDEWVLADPWPTPNGVAFLGECETEEVLLAVIDEVAASLEAHGIDARVGPLTSNWYPWPSQPGYDDGFCAAMTIVGEAHCDTPGDPGERRLTQRMWDVDPQARAQMVEHAVRWCDVAGGSLWLETGITCFKIPREHAVAILTRCLEVDPESSIVAARDAALWRRVAFGRNGYLIYELGGTAKPGWHDCVDELTSVLIDTHHLMVWGYVLRRPPGVYGLGPRTTRVLHEALWAPYERNVAPLGYRQDPRRSVELVLDVYGVQVLGPGHDTRAVSNTWIRRDLSAGRTLVSAADPAAWFADSPSMETLLEARGSFGPLVDPIWSPAKD